MSKSMRSAISAAVVLPWPSAALLLMSATGRTVPAGRRRPHAWPPTDSLRWYRGNLHTHSLWSDGDDYLETIGLWYKEHGYDFLVLHRSQRPPGSPAINWINIDRNGSGPKALGKLKARFPGDWVETRTVDGKTEVRLKTLAEVRPRLEEPGRFMLLQGEEISDWYGLRPDPSERVERAAADSADARRQHRRNDSERRRRGDRPARADGQADPGPSQSPELSITRSPPRT